MFAVIYDGVDEVLSLFKGRPNMWNRQQLEEFLGKTGLAIVRKYDRKRYVDDDWTLKLQHLGFLGLGSRRLDSPAGTERYNVKYSFLEDVPTRRPWEIAVVSPVFYDPYGITAVGGTIVKPHEPLTLPMSVLRQLATYDVELNTFCAGLKLLSVW